MSKTDKDNRLKQKAVKFCLISGLIPFLNVKVRSSAELGNAPEYLTDVDVLGVSVGDSGRLRRTLVDCKTSRLSAINRAFWAAGLMQYLDAVRAIVLLERKAVETHRLAGREIGAFLFDEDTFDVYARAISVNFGDPPFYMAKLERWFIATEAVARFPRLEHIASFLAGDVALPGEASSHFRYLVGVTRSVRGEFDPAKSIHMYLFCELISAGLLLMAMMINEIKGIFDPHGGKEEFGRTLRYYIWGGRESYEMRRKMIEISRSNGHADAQPLEFYQWDAFIELFRSFGDAPGEIVTSVIPMKEIAFRHLSSADPLCDNNLSNLLRSNRRNRQYIFALIDYIILATNLPRDFKSNTEKIVNCLMVERQA